MRSGTILLVLLLATCAAAQHEHGAAAAAGPSKGMLLEGMGHEHVHHPVSTKNPQAQRFFDQGLALSYAFNHDEAARSFERAAELDPDLAMAWWGVALVHGSNYNLPSLEERERRAHEAIQKALKLSGHASEAERAYIHALAKRYSGDPQADRKQLAVAYKEAMGDLMRRYPDDLNAATLYAESMMNLRPWALWNADGTPAPGTEEIISVLESVMLRSPNHTGANHLYIHAVEPGPNPQRGLPAANRLADLAPGAGHLVHMPGHIYFRVGQFDDAAKTNVKAAAADRKYIAQTQPVGIYPAMYFSHNMHFEAIAHMMAGRYQQAMSAADELEKHALTQFDVMPMVETVFLPTRHYGLVRFEKWDDILALKAPDPRMKYVTAMWHFARGMAYAGKDDGKNAAAERQKLAAATALVPQDMMIDQNPAHTALQLADHYLASRIAELRGDPAAAAKELQAATLIQDDMKYIEPPEFPFPIWEALGMVYLRAGEPAKAEQAFRRDLQRFPGNGRSLYGLAQSLRQQNKNYDAQLIEMRFNDAWKTADTRLPEVGAQAARANE